MEAVLGAQPVMYDRSLEELTPRPDVAELADEAGEGWPMMGHVARLAESLDDEEAWDAVICAGIIEP